MRAPVATWVAPTRREHVTECWGPAQPKSAFQAIVDVLKRGRQRRGCCAAVTDSEGCCRTSQMVAALSSRKGNAVVFVYSSDEHVAPDASRAPRTSQSADRPISTRSRCASDLVDAAARARSGSFTLEVGAPRGARRVSPTMLRGPSCATALSKCAGACSSRRLRSPFTVAAVSFGRRVRAPDAEAVSDLSRQPDGHPRHRHLPDARGVVRTICPTRPRSS
jgi:hypothetical protein